MRTQAQLKVGVISQQTMRNNNAHQQNRSDAPTLDQATETN